MLDLIVAELLKQGSSWCWFPFHSSPSYNWLPCKIVYKKVMKHYFVLDFLTLFILILFLMFFFYCCWKKIYVFVLVFIFLCVCRYSLDNGLFCDSRKMDLNYLFSQFHLNISEIRSGDYLLVPGVKCIQIRKGLKVFCFCKSSALFKS